VVYDRPDNIFEKVESVFEGPKFLHFIVLLSLVLIINSFEGNA
jgi:hypothetical protein